MFHSLTTETKRQNDPTRSQAIPERERKLSPHVSTDAGPAWARVGSGGVPSGTNHGIPQPLARLHATYGNQAVLRMLSPQAAMIQTKLTVNQPGDQYEQEADRVADQVMRMSVPSMVQRSCSACQNEEKVQRKCAECEEEEKKTGLQRKKTNARPEFPPSSVHAVLNSPGQPLDAATRAFMEPRFGCDFGDVRVHTDAKSTESARAVNALAYTVGNHVVFGSGQLTPGSNSGRRLLAHELVHTIQQTGGGDRKSSLSNPDHTTGQAAASQSAQTPKILRRPAFGRAAPMIARQNDMDAGLDGGSNSGPSDAALPAGVTTPPPEPAADAVPSSTPVRKCGPDITTSLTTMLGTVEPWFRGLTGFQQDRSCMGLGPAGFLVGVNPIMAWDTRELFLPNTGWLDSYFSSSACGSPRDPGCPTDPTRNLCETAGSCGNSVVVGGKCMLAGTANYALFGKICRLCHDYTGRWNRWDMRAIIGAYKTISGDDSTPPKEMASAAYDGTLPSVPAAAENRGTCTDRCGVTHGGGFDFIWEPYRPR